MLIGVLVAAILLVLGAGPGRAANQAGSTATAPAQVENGRIIYKGANTLDYVMNADGTGARRFDNPLGNPYGVWSPDGTKIAYMRYTGGGIDLLDGCSIYVSRRDGSNVRRLTNSGACDSVTR